MTPLQIERVQASYGEIRPMGEAVGETFYLKLFEIAPELRPLFKSDLKVQGAQFVTMLGAVVAGLTDIEKLLPVISQLAASHVSHGARPEHYPVVGEALLRTLEDVLGDRFTSDVSLAWSAAYDALSGAMIDAAYPELVVARLSAAE